MSTENETTGQDGDWDGLLVEASEDDMSKEDLAKKSIVPNIEHKLSSKKRRECRDIVLEIKKFGVSQRQLLFIIQLLSLELEDIETMKALGRVIGENRENTPLDAVDLSTSTPSSIIISSE